MKSDKYLKNYMRIQETVQNADEQRLNPNQITNSPQKMPNSSITKRVEVNLKGEKNFLTKEQAEILNKQRFANILLKENEVLTSKLQKYNQKLSKKSSGTDKIPVTPLSPTESSKLTMNQNLSEKKLFKDGSSVVTTKANRGKTISNPTLLNFLNNHPLPESIKSKVTPGGESKGRGLSGATNTYSSASHLNFLDGENVIGTAGSSIDFDLESIVSQSHMVSLMSIPDVCITASSTGV